MNDARIRNERLSAPDSTWWTLEVDDVLLNLKIDRDQGLPSDEARVRLERYGYNRLPEAKRISPPSLSRETLLCWRPDGCHADRS